MNMYRDRGYYWLRLAVYITIALGLGTIYRGLGHSYESIQVICFVHKMLMLQQFSLDETFMQQLT